MQNAHYDPEVEAIERFLMKCFWRWLRKWYWKLTGKNKGFTTSQLRMPLDVPEWKTRGAIRRGILKSRPWDVKAREKLKHVKRQVKKRGKP